MATIGQTVVAAALMTPAVVVALGKRNAATASVDGAAAAGCCDPQHTNMARWVPMPRNAAAAGDEGAARNASATGDGGGCWCWGAKAAN